MFNLSALDAAVLCYCDGLKGFHHNLRKSLAAKSGFLLLPQKVGTKVLNDKEISFVLFGDLEVTYPTLEKLKSLKRSQYVLGNGFQSQPGQTTAVQHLLAQLLELQPKDQNSNASQQFSSREVSGQPAVAIRSLGIQCGLLQMDLKIYQDCSSFLI